MRKQAPEDHLMSEIANLGPGPVYSFPDFIVQMSVTKPKRVSYSVNTNLISSLLHQLGWAGKGVPMYRPAPKKDKEKRVDSWPRLTWRAFLQCGSGCGCWEWWPQQRRGHSSHTWKVCRWSGWPRGSSVLTAGKRTGSSGHTGRVCNKQRVTGHGVLCRSALWGKGMGL